MRVKKIMYSLFFLSLPLPKFYEKYIDVLMMNLNSKGKKNIERIPLLESFSNFDDMFLSAIGANFEISNFY